MSAARPTAGRLLSGARLAVRPKATCPTTTPMITTGRTTIAPATAVVAACTTSPAASPCHGRVPARPFHSSPQLSARRRPRFANVRASDTSVMDEKQIEQFTKDKFPRYTPEELEHLRKIYSPEQMAALEAGEAAIDPRDLTVQGRLRADPYRMPYIDDFAETQPIIDKRARNKDPPDPHARFMDLDEFAQDLVDWADKLPQGDVTGRLKRLEDFVPKEYRARPETQWPADVREEARKQFQRYMEGEVAKQAALDADGDDVSDTGGPTDADILQYILERSAMTDQGRQTDSSLAPALPDKVPGVAGLYKTTVSPEDQGLDDLGVYQDVKRRTGMSVRQLLKLQSKQLVVRYVSNQTRLGKVRSISVMHIVGNGDGWLGLGEAKSTEPTVAFTKARLNAMRSMRPIRRYENRTIYGTITAKVSATIVKLEARPPGFGLRAPYRIFEMCRAAGIYDITASMPRSRNPMNSVRATYWALCNQPDPEEIARARGKKLVDARKVYYGGAVY